MIGAIRFLRGYVRMEIRSASPELTLNLLSKRDISYWNICPLDEFTLQISLLRKDRKAAQEIVRRSLGEFEIVSEYGVPLLQKKLLHRPVFSVGMLLAIFLSFYLTSFVWVIRVEGNDRVSAQKITQALDALGVRIGMHGNRISLEETKNQMISMLPELSWVATNRTGALLTVLVTERSAPSSDIPDYPLAHLVAQRDGLLTNVQVYQGMKLCAAGDAVKRGQVLVSGYEDYGLFIREVCADGEIYAKTWHTGTLVTPSVTMIKTYTGRQWTHRTLVVGRKRINLFGSSWISEKNCDKMVQVTELTLPGYRFPLWLETETYREYTLQPETRPDSQRLLSAAWERSVKADMTAGTILRSDGNYLQSGDLSVFHAQSACEEMIAVLKPLKGTNEGDENERTNDQRRTN